jgi:hypothetical protein
MREDVKYAPQQFQKWVLADMGRQTLLHEDPSHLSRVAAERGGEIGGAMDPKHKHCWHAEGVSQSTGSIAIWKEQCCWCGIQRTMQQYRVVEPGHGPKAPPRYSGKTRELPPGVSEWQTPTE